MNWFIRRKQVKPVPQFRPLPSGKSLDDFRQHLPLTNAVRDFLATVTGRELLAMLLNELPIGPISTETANPIGTAIAHGETRGHLRVIAMIRAASIHVEEPAEIPQNYGADEAQD